MTAISDMVAPVVLITLATIFANGQLTLAATIAQNVLALNRERLEILSGPDGEMLDQESVPPTKRERLRQIGDQVPQMVMRFRRIRTAVIVFWIAIGMLVLSVAAISAAVTADSEGFAFTALALVLARVATVFVGIATLIGMAVRWGDFVIDDAKRTGLIK